MEISSKYSNKVNDTQLWLNFSQCHCLLSVLIAISRCSWSSLRRRASESWQASNTVVWGIRRGSLGPVLSYLSGYTSHTWETKHKLALLPPFWLQYMARSKALYYRHLRDCPNTVIIIISSPTGTPQHNCLFSTHINIPNILSTGRQKVQETPYPLQTIYKPQRYATIYCCNFMYHRVHSSECNYETRELDSVPVHVEHLASPEFQVSQQKKWKYLPLNLKLQLCHLAQHLSHSKYLLF